jgi:hypothetical protein
MPRLYVLPRWLKSCGQHFAQRPFGQGQPVVSACKHDSLSANIGDRVSDMNKQGANIQYIQNPVDTGIESYEDFEKHNKKFIPSWNLKHLTGPFKGETKKIKK